MFDGLQNRNVATVTLLSLIYFVILVGSVSLGIIQVYLRMALQRRWRAWLNGQPIDRWLAQGRYYQLNLLTGDHTNPEYRIADDVRIATDSPVDFVSGTTQAMLSAVTFIAVLWTIGGALDLNILGIPIHAPGFLVIAAALYASIASVSMVLIGQGRIQAHDHQTAAGMIASDTFAAVTSARPPPAMRCCQREHWLGLTWQVIAQERGAYGCRTGNSSNQTT